MKKLYIPGKVWLNQNDFISEFPQTKLPLVMLLGDSLGKWTVTKGTGLGIDQWAYDKKVETYRDIVKFVLSPEFPLTIKFQPNPDLAGRGTLFPFISKEADQTCFSWLGAGAMMTSPYPKQTGFSSLTLAWIMAYYMKEIEIKVSPLGASLENCRRVYKDQMIDEFSSRGFKYFEIKAQAEWRQLNEVYGINDISQVPANTISYVVTGQPPPMPENAKYGTQVVTKDNWPSIWQSAEMWSALFSDPMGIAVLNAVAKNLPIKIKTRVENWRNPDQYLVGVTREEDKKKIVTTFTYVWQDFEFEVDAKCSIVVRYNRGIDTAQLVILKSSDWKAILMGVGFLVAFVAVGVALGAVGAAAPVAAAPVPAVTAGASVAGSTNTAAVLAATVPAVPAAGILPSAALTAPVVGAPTLTGIAGYSSLMAMGATPAVVTGAGLTAAAVIPTVAGAVGKATLFESIVAAVPSVLPAVAKAGIGIWAVSEKTKIQEELIKAGYNPDLLEQIIPEGKTTEGYAYKPVEAGIFGIDPKMLLLVGGAVIATYLIADSRETTPKTKYKHKIKKKGGK